MLDRQVDDGLLNLRLHPVAQDRLAFGDLGQRELATLLVELLEAIELSQLSPMILQAWDTLPSCLASSSKPTLARITLRSSVMFGSSVLGYREEGLPSFRSRVARTKQTRMSDQILADTDYVGRKSTTPIAARSRRRSAAARSITPPSEVMRPPSNAAVTFLRRTAGKPKLSIVSSCMAGVARSDQVNGSVSTPNPETRSAAYATPAHPNKSLPCHEYERLSAKAYPRAFGQRLHYPLTAEEWTHALLVAVTPIPAMLSLAALVGERAKLGVLTNNSLLVRERVDQLFPGLRPIFGTAICVSSQFRIRKPEPDVYRRSVAYLGHAAEQSLFVDDSAANVAGAEQAGLLGHHHTTEAALTARMRELGLL